jgi:DNA-binding XRE family transcriptional regulator
MKAVRKLIPVDKSEIKGELKKTLDGFIDFHNSEYNLFKNMTSGIVQVGDYYYELHLDGRVFKIVTEFEAVMSLREVIKKSGYSQSEIARMMGISRQTLSRWVTGKVKPRMASLRKLAELCGIDYKNLI